jgi:hypothetical protein
MNPRFTAPKSFIKNTTYYFACGPGTFQCYPGSPESKGLYSYWNAKGSFRPQNPNAPLSTTTLRFRTTMSNPNPTTNSPHTAMYDPVTPTTTWGGRYDASRGGSIMIWPGNNRFGGTMRFFEGPNARFYQLITIEGPYSTATSRKPLSQQIGRRRVRARRGRAAARDTATDSPSRITRREWSSGRPPWAIRSTTRELRTTS